MERGLKKLIVDFTVQGEPFGKQRPRLSTVNGFSMAYTPQKTIVKEAIIRGEFERQCGNAYFSEGAVSILILFNLPIPASTSKRKKDKTLSGIIHPTKKPDIDNATKLILDALNGAAWKDDKQVCFQLSVKQFSEYPCIRVIIEGKTEGDELYDGTLRNLYSRSLHRYWSLGI